MNIHLLSMLNVELSGAEETEHGQGIEALVEARLLEGSAELVNLSILLGCGVAGMSALVGVGDGGEVVVIVLGVLSDCGHCEVCRCCWLCVKRGDCGQAVMATKECLEVLPRVLVRMVWQKGGDRVKKVGVGRKVDFLSCL